MSLILASIGPGNGSKDFIQDRHINDESNLPATNMYRKANVLKKQHRQKDKVTKVTFALPAEVEGKTVPRVGDFNEPQLIETELFMLAKVLEQ